jgi:transposase
VAARFGVSRQTVHNWLARYEAGGWENLEDGSYRPRSCPHQMDVPVSRSSWLLRWRSGTGCA